MLGVGVILKTIPQLLHLSIVIVDLFQKQSSKRDNFHIRQSDCRLD